jgi:hypothetical protein
MFQLVEDCYVVARSCQGHNLAERSERQNLVARDAENVETSLNW